MILTQAVAQLFSALISEAKTACLSPRICSFCAEHRQTLLRMRIFIINIAFFNAAVHARDPLFPYIQTEPDDVHSFIQRRPARVFCRRSLLMQALVMETTVVERPRSAARKAQVSIAYRLAVASRIAAALFGGYVLAALTSICLAQFLPLPRVHAVVLGMTLCFLTYPPAVIWCFACRSALRAWVGLALPCAVIAAVCGCARWLA